MFLEIWPNSCLVSVVSLGMLMQRYVTYLTKAFLCFVLIMKYFRNRFVGKFVSKIFPIKTTSNYSNSAVTKLYANYCILAEANCPCIFVNICPKNTRLLKHFSLVTYYNVWGQPLDNRFT